MIMFDSSCICRIDVDLKGKGKFGVNELITFLVQRKLRSISCLCVKKKKIRAGVRTCSDFLRDWREQWEATARPCPKFKRHTSAVHLLKVGLAEL